MVLISWIIFIMLKIVRKIVVLDISIGSVYIVFFIVRINFVICIWLMRYG